LFTKNSIYFSKDRWNVSKLSDDNARYEVGESVTDLNSITRQLVNSHMSEYIMFGIVLSLSLNLLLNELLNVLLDLLLKHEAEHKTRSRTQDTKQRQEVLL
jgi:hypothetical protein